jgi:uncharacterized membrane protein
MKKILNALIGVIFLAPFLYLGYTWKSLPAKLPIHYNLKGEADRFGGPVDLLIMALVITAVNIGVYFLLRNAHRIDRRRNAKENVDSMHRIAFVVSVFVSAVMCLIIYSSANHVNSINSFSGIIFSGIGLLFSFIGNYMYNIKPNYIAGLRLPWTLKNEENWKKTHHLGGKLWFFGGLIIAIICLGLSFKSAIIVFFIAIAILVTIPVVYSYRLYKKNRI